ncbi:MAG: phosphomethylpyrimidine synthase, partial [Thermoprotei archaeon]
VLGPLPIDIAAPYDHIAAAAGASIAAAAGADLLCYLTPAEHLSLPTPEQVKLGLIATKIAAHIGDVVKYGSRAMKKDLEVSKLRAEVEIRKTIPYLISPEDAEAVFKQFGVAPSKGCTMCGGYCPLLLLKEQMQKASKK